MHLVHGLSLATTLIRDLSDIVLVKSISSHMCNIEIVAVAQKVLLDTGYKLHIVTVMCGL